jgi:hypothetical protein
MQRQRDREREREKEREKERKTGEGRSVKVVALHKVRYLIINEVSVISSKLCSLQRSELFGRCNEVTGLNMTP